MTETQRPRPAGIMLAIFVNQNDKRLFLQEGFLGKKTKEEE